VYQGACFACHATGALDAPKKGDAAAWKPRLAQGMETLHKHAIDGIRAMPPRGTCGDCSDDDILNAIKFMTDGL
jgi:cytochrome c5